MSQNYTTSETCIYCEKTAGSKEDVFPKWLQKRFKGSATIEFQDHMHAIPRTRYNVFSLRIEVYTVCGKCNNEWMSQLQNDAKPVIESLLDNPSVILNVHDCKLLTSWAAMSMITLETRNPKNAWVFTDLERTLFYYDRTMPVHTHVCLCKWNNSPGPSYNAMFLERQGDRHGHRGFVFTFGFGTLLFQVLKVLPANPTILDDLGWLTPIRPFLGTTS